MWYSMVSVWYSVVWYVWSGMEWHGMVSFGVGSPTHDQTRSVPKCHTESAQGGVELFAAAAKHGRLIRQKQHTFSQSRKSFESGGNRCRVPPEPPETKYSEIPRNHTKTPRKAESKVPGATGDREVCRPSRRRRNTAKFKETIHKKP